MELFDNGRALSSAMLPQGRLLVHAPNIHQGGGRTLLVALLESLASSQESGKRIQVTLDRRLEIEKGLASRLEVNWVAPSLGERLRAEWNLARDGKQEDVLLCFGNLPPMFPVKARVVLFLQNYYLIGRRSVPELPIRLKTRLLLERLWLRSAVHRCQTVVVQSPTMQQLARDELGVEAMIAPFVGGNMPRGQPPEEKTLDFLYVASGEPHKNHRELIRAWIHLANQGAFPSLGLTLDPLVHGSLCRWIQENISAYELSIRILGTLSASQLEKTYQGSKALIFPSLFESFGLPLVEAHAFGLPILAPERDYVRDVITPVESFDPESAVSIARAVMRHLSMHQKPTILMSASEFLEEVLQPVIA